MDRGILGVRCPLSQTISQIQRKKQNKASPSPPASFLHVPCHSFAAVDLLHFLRCRMYQPTRPRQGREGYLMSSRRQTYVGMFCRSGDAANLYAQGYRKLHVLCHVAWTLNVQEYQIKTVLFFFVFFSQTHGSSHKPAYFMPFIDNASHHLLRL